MKRKLFIIALLGCLILTGQQPPSTIGLTQAGAQRRTGNSISPERSDKTGALAIADAHGRYQEAVLQGRVFTGSTIQATVAAANNSPATAGTGQPLVGIFNPAGSGVDIVILRTIVGSASGTPAAQPFFIWNVIPAPCGITAAGSQAINNYSFNSSGSAARTFLNAATTGSVAGTAFRIIGGTSATAIGAGIYSFAEEGAGDIIIPPGAFAGVYVGNGAGTTWIVSASVTWEEVTTGGY